MEGLAQSGEQMKSISPATEFAEALNLLKTRSSVAVFIVPKASGAAASNQSSAPSGETSDGEPGSGEGAPVIITRIVNAASGQPKGEEVEAPQEHQPQQTPTLSMERETQSESPSRDPDTKEPRGCSVGRSPVSRVPAPQSLSSRNETGTSPNELDMPHRLRTQQNEVSQVVTVEEPSVKKSCPNKVPVAVPKEASSNEGASESEMTYNLRQHPQPSRRRPKAIPQQRKPVLTVVLPEAHTEVQKKIDYVVTQVAQSFGCVVRAQNIDYKQSNRGRPRNVNFPFGSIQRCPVSLPTSIAPRTEERRNAASPENCSQMRTVEPQLYPEVILSEGNDVSEVELK